MLVWRIKQMLNELWSPEQIVGVLAKDGIKVSVQSVYNIINADTSGELRRNCRHPNFKRRPSPSRKPVKATNIAGVQAYTTALPRQTASASATLRWTL